MLRCKGQNQEKRWITLRGHGAPAGAPMPTAQMKRGIAHWTAGGSGIDRSYHVILIEGDSKFVQVFLLSTSRRARLGPWLCRALTELQHRFDQNFSVLYGQHSRELVKGRTCTDKTHSIGNAACYLADLCRRYMPLVSPHTDPSHADVQDMLRIKQRGRSDISQLAFDPSVIVAMACSDHFGSSSPALLGSLI